MPPPRGGVVLRTEPGGGSRIFSRPARQGSAHAEAPSSLAWVSCTPVAYLFALATVRGPVLRVGCFILRLCLGYFLFLSSLGESADLPAHPSTRPFQEIFQDPWLSDLSSHFLPLHSSLFSLIQDARVAVALALYAEVQGNGHLAAGGRRRDRQVPSQAAQMPSPHERGSCGSVEQASAQSGQASWRKWCLR